MDASGPGAVQMTLTANGAVRTLTARSLTEASAAATTTVAQAMRLERSNAGDRGAVLVAGGIDLLDLMKEHLLEPDMLVSLRGIAGLDRIVAEREGGLWLGAMATLAMLAEHAEVQKRYPALADALRIASSPQIRAVATLGGNLLQRPRCGYFRARECHCTRKGGSHCFAHAGENQYHAVFDNHGCAIVHPSSAATVLVALGATLELRSPGGRSRTMRIEDFIVPSARDPTRENLLEPREILIAVRLPPMAAGTCMAHLRQGERAAFDWPLAEVAVVLGIGPDARCRSAAIVLGAAAPVPHRARRAEQSLLGRPITDSLAREAARAALDGAAPLSQNGYKLALFETLVRRAILGALDAHRGRGGG